MSKEALFVALGINKSQNLSNLKKTTALFDKTLKGLRSGDAELGLPATESGRILRQLDKIDGLWSEYSAVMNTIASSGSVSEEQVAFISGNSLPLLKEMNKAVGLYEKAAQATGLESDPSLATTINLSGKQRMLTQKMTKELLLVIYKHKVEDNKIALMETTSLFDQTLSGLMEGDANLELPRTENPAIRGQLGVVTSIWNDFKPAIDQGIESGGQYPQNKLEQVEKDNLNLLKEMNKAVGMYADSAAG